MGLGEIRLGEMGLGEMGLGEMGQNRNNRLISCGRKKMMKTRGGLCNT